MEVLPLRAGLKKGPFDLYGDLDSAARGAGEALRDGDVAVVSSKYAAASQGRTVQLGRVRSYPGGRRISERYGVRPPLAELIHRESDSVLGGVAGFVMATWRGILAPNAGIDSSNAGGAEAVLYPAEPHREAEDLRRRIFLGAGARAGVVFSDSRLMPARAGTAAVAVAWAGIRPVRDMRASPDLHGRPLRVTMEASADSVATAANHVMGEGAESVPYALVRGSRAALTAGDASPSEPAVRPGACVYARAYAAPGQH